MKACPEEGWDDEPFDTVLTLSDGAKITIYGVTVNTIDDEIRETIQRYHERRKVILQNAKA